MDAYDPTELLLLCDSILEDGEISGDELYDLATWLNDHRDACFHWPGNILVGPLQDVWADGHVTKTEMRQIGRLLVRIRKDWARQQSALAAQQAALFAEQLCHKFDLTNPATPCIPYTTRIKSHSEPGLHYDVDLSAPSCTCPDWRSVRQSLPATHLSRCCKHILEAYGNLEPAGGWPGWFGPFVDSGYPPHPRAQWMVLNIGGRTVLASASPTGWTNVYAQNHEGYDRFGYNIDEDRWSYGMEPDGADYIARAIQQARL